jgi:hypothetical protein
VPHLLPTTALLEVLVSRTTSHKLVRRSVSSSVVFSVEALVALVVQEAQLALLVSLDFSEEAVTRSTAHQNHAWQLQ